MENDPVELKNKNDYYPIKTCTDNKTHSENKIDMIYKGIFYYLY